MVTSAAYRRTVVVIGITKYIDTHVLIIIRLDDTFARTNCCNVFMPERLSFFNARFHGFTGLIRGNLSD